MVRAVDMERSDRYNQPIAEAQSGFTVYMSPARGLLPQQSLREDACFGSRAAMEDPSLY